MLFQMKEWTLLHILMNLSKNFLRNLTKTTNQSRRNLKHSKRMSEFSLKTNNISLCLLRKWWLKCYQCVRKWRNGSMNTKRRTILIQPKRKKKLKSQLLPWHKPLMKSLISLTTKEERLKKKNLRKVRSMLWMKQQLLELQECLQW